MEVQNNLGDYFAQFNKPLNVNVISKLTKWTDLQSIGHDAILVHLKNNFYGIKDAKVQFEKYTAGNALQLAKPYQGIQAMILQNAETQKLLSDDDVLGEVGPAVSGISDMGAVFSLPASSLTGGSESVAEQIA